ncbi:MAG: AmmeMemoRadiSam system protein B, partial [Burkholderiales bacterium]
MNAVRPPAVAGTFYPGSRSALEKALATLLANTKPSEKCEPPFKAVIVPHAGYVYS